MQLIFMITGTISAILFLIMMIRGKKYENMLVNLDSNIFPVNELYGVGFAWSELSLFKLKGEKGTKLKTEAASLFEHQYGEYYANVIWAETITLVHLFLTMTLLCAAAFNSMQGIVLIIGILMTVAVGNYSYTYMSEKLKKRTESCDQELPEVVSSMAILINSGMILKEAWDVVSESREGEFYQLMRQAKHNMENGFSDADAIYLFGKESNSVEIKKFVSSLLQSMEKGGGEIASFMANQSKELWSSKRQRMLQEGEKAATKLLIPIVLMFLGIMIIIITAAFAGALF